GLRMVAGAWPLSFWDRLLQPYEPHEPPAGESLLWAPHLSRADRDVERAPDAVQLPVGVLRRGILVRMETPQRGAAVITSSAAEETMEPQRREFLTTLVGA